MGILGQRQSVIATSSGDITVDLGRAYALITTANAIELAEAGSYTEAPRARSGLKRPASTSTTRSVRQVTDAPKVAVSLRQGDRIESVSITPEAG
jgi:hypothetical protein